MLEVLHRYVVGNARRRRQARLGQTGSRLHAGLQALRWLCDHSAPPARFGDAPIGAAPSRPGVVWFATLAQGNLRTVALSGAQQTASRQISIQQSDVYDSGR